MVTYKNIKAFIELSKAPSYAVAAKALFITQPALSTSIKNLESQLGGKLFTRSTRKIELSPEGKLFLPKATQLMIDYESVIGDAKALFKAHQGNLVLCAMPSFAESLLAELLVGFMGENPNIKVRVLDMVMEQVIENVLARRAEIGFVFKPRNLTGLQFMPMFTDEFCLIVSPRHPLATVDTIRAWLDEAIAEYIIEHKSEQYPLSEQSLNIVAEASQLGTIGQLVLNEVGIAIVPQMCTFQMQNKGLLVKKISDLKLDKEVGILTVAPANLSKVATELISFVEKNSQNYGEN